MAVQINRPRLAETRKPRAQQQARGTGRDRDQSKRPDDDLQKPPGDHEAAGAKVSASPLRQ